MRYHAVMEFDLHPRVHERRPAAECSIAPLLVAGLLTAAGAAVGAGGAAAANKQTGNKARIKELEQLQATQRLTAGDEALVNQVRQANRRAADEAAMQAANMAANAGATSGRDMAALASANTEAQQAAADKASAAWAQMYGQEGQELEDRKAIRRDRTMEVVNYFSKGLTDLGSAVGGYAGAKGAPATSKSTPVDVGGDDLAAFVFGLSESDPELYQRLMDEMEASGMAEDS